MIRCLWTLLTLFFTHALSAQGVTTQLPRAFSQNTLRGQVTFLTPPPAISLNGRDALLSPGTQIRNQNNLVVLSGTLVGQTFKVNYTLDPIITQQVQVQDIWILTPEEAANTPWPKTTVEASAWRFDNAAQRWHKH